MAYRKTQATEERIEARRRHVLDTAIKLFGKHGYHATTVPMIVEEAGVSTGSFYMYFRNKEDVFEAALKELGQAIVNVLNQVNESQPDPLAKIPKGAEALFMFLAENPEMARILLVESSGLSPGLDRARRSILIGQEEELRKIFESAPALFDVEDPVIAARCIAGATFEAAYCWLEEDAKTRMSAADVAKAVARFNLQAVRKTSRPKAGTR